MAEFKKIFDGSKWNLHVNNRFIGQHPSKESIEKAVNNLETAMDEDYIDASSLMLASASSFTVPLGECVKPQQISFECSALCDPTNVNAELMAYTSDFVPPPMLPRIGKRESMLGKQVIINKSGKIGTIEAVLEDEHRNVIHEVAFEGYSSENFFERHEFEMLEDISNARIAKTHRTTVFILVLITLSVLCTYAGIFLAEKYRTPIKKAVDKVQEVKEELY